MAGADELRDTPIDPQQRSKDIAEDYWHLRQTLDDKLVLRHIATKYSISKSEIVRIAEQFPPKNRPR
jgi:hypothetical protein